MEREREWVWVWVQGGGCGEGGRLVRVRAAAAPASPGTWWPLTAGAGVLDGFVHGQDEAGGLRGSGERVDAHDGWLPHARHEVVGDVLVVDVDAVPHAALEDEGRVG